MFGERIRPSPYKLKFGEDRQCKQVCTKKYTGPDSITYLPYVRHPVLQTQYVPYTKNIPVINVVNRDQRMMTK